MSKDDDDDDDEHKYNDDSRRPVSEEEKLLNQWKTFRAAANDEKRWMNERFKWLSVAQPFLFAGMLLILGADSAKPALDQHRDVLLSAITALGLFVSVVAGAGVLAAAWMHWIWFTNLKELAQALNDGRKLPVASFGMKPYWPSRLSTLVAPSISLAFVLCWLWLPYKLGLNLLAVTAPSVAVAIILSVVVQYVRNGWKPMWPFAK